MYVCIYKNITLHAKVDYGAGDDFGDDHAPLPNHKTPGSAYSLQISIWYKMVE